MDQRTTNPRPGAVAVHAQASETLIWSQGESAGSAVVPDQCVASFLRTQAESGEMPQSRGGV